ncbi:PPOX class F420-dependent oxidoreductase [Actinophytocola sp.]|uniref:PPOX class F420-dependent oxidoreductase n=1 Tax=Actinophytocola sp. TaxID=1872138 RepID=UPI002D80D07E|nr:PPOX class F420-dependent oxidoreductase [Actinophytocola sp.]HET9143450.1 PPOX class F420-dependent oxidoreductase [Actinophytocola sp.]
MTKLNAAARQLISSGALAHLVTINADGSPQVSVVWMGLDGDDLVAGHLNPAQLKIANMRRDPRVSVSFESDRANPAGLREHLIVHGTAELTEGGAAELLARLAKTYIGPDAVFPPMPNPPAGLVARITVKRVTGVGDWK